MSPEKTQPTVIDSKKDGAERFIGEPTQVPFRPAIINLRYDQDKLLKPGTTTFNNGLFATHNEDKTITVGYQEDAPSTATTGIEAFVPFTGSDHSGWPDGSNAHIFARMTLNRNARASGVMGRLVKDPNSGEDYYTANPFDDGDYLEMSHVAEIDPITGTKILNQDLEDAYTARDNADGLKNLDRVGSFARSNGVLAWYTPEGKIQIAPDTEERVGRLEELGYNKGEFIVPHSNGEQFQENQLSNPAQVYADIKLRDMQRRGETMTNEQRDIEFGKVVIKPEFLELIVS